MFLPDIVKQINKLKKLAVKEVLYATTALSGSAGCYVLGVDNSTGDIYYRDVNGNWALASSGSGGGGGGQSCDTLIDASTTNNGCPLDEQYISLLIDDGITPLPWRGTWEEFKACIGTGGGGGAAMRFGVSGEDFEATVGENRSFELNDQELDIQASNTTDGSYRIFGVDTNGYVYMEADNDQGFAYMDVAANPGDYKPRSGMYVQGGGENTELAIYPDEAIIQQSLYGNGQQNIVTSLEDHKYIADITGDVTLLSKVNNNGILALPDGLYSNSPLPDGLLYGGIVTWHHDYVYEVTAAGYVIDGIFYQSPARTVAGGNPVTLNAPDPTDDRIDVFYVDESEDVEVLEGTPAPSPVKPSVAANQIELSFATAETGTTEPTQPTVLVTEMIYNENLGEPVEWTGSVSSAKVELGGVPGVEGSFAARFDNTSEAGEWVEFVNDVPVTVNNLTVLTLKLVSDNSSKPQNKRLTISFEFGGSSIGNSLTIKNNNYGIDWGSAQTQTLSIALADFGIDNSSVIDGVHFELTSTGKAKFPLRLDKIQLQGVPVAPTVQPAGKTRFGIEDNTGIQNRLMNMGAYGLDITAGDPDYNIATTDFYLTSNGLAIYSQDDTAVYSSRTNTTALFIELRSTEDAVSRRTLTVNSYETTITRTDYVAPSVVTKHIATSVEVNGTEYNADINGKIDIGAIAGGGGNIIDTLDQTTNAGATSTRDIYLQGVRVGRGAGAIATNTALGENALGANTTGSKNTAIGDDALAINSTSTDNVAVGTGALALNTTGAGFNTAVGVIVLGKNTTGYSNTGVGSYSMQEMQSGNNNTSVGVVALRDNTSGLSNTAIGAFALAKSQTGIYNTAIGANALTNLVGGATRNVAIGTFSLQQSISGEYNTAVGEDTFIFNTTGSYMTALGNRAGYNALGTRNVFLGYRAGYQAVGDDLLYISNSETNNLITGSFSAKTLKVDGKLTVTSLDTDLTAPVTTGTTKMVITDNTGQLSFADIPSGGGSGADGYNCLYDITYADLVTAIAGSTLEVGCYYRITDFQTVHTLTTMFGETPATHTGTINPITIKAVAVNKLAEYGDCGLYPGDTIYYRVANDGMLPGSTKGYIYRRIDHALNINLPIDFKEVRYRRYAANHTNAWDIGTSYTKGEIVTHDSGKIFKAMRDNVGITPTTAYDNRDWAWLAATNGDVILVANIYSPIGSLGGNGVEADSLTFIDYPIFDSVGYALGTYGNIYMEDQANSQTDQFYFGDNIYAAFDNVFIEFCYFHNVRMDSYTKFAGNTFKGINHTYNGACKVFHSSLSSHCSMLNNYMFKADVYDTTLTGESNITNNVFNENTIGNSSLANASTIYNTVMGNNSNIVNCSLNNTSRIEGHIIGGLEECTLFDAKLYDVSETYIWKSHFFSSRVYFNHSSNMTKTFHKNTWKSVTMSTPLAFGSILQASTYHKEIISRQDGTPRVQYMDNSNVWTNVAL